MKIKTDRDTGLVIFCLFIIPLCAFLSPWFGVAIIFVMSLYYMIQNSNRTLLFFVCILLVQNITLAISANHFSSTTTTIFSICKEAMLYGCIFLVILRKKRISRNVFAIVAFLMVIFVSFSFSDASIYAKIVSIRPILLPFICTLFGMGIEISNEKIQKIGRFIVYTSLIVGLLGLLELFVIGDTAWHTLPLWQYQVNKGTTFYFTNDLPTNFITYDLKAITGTFTKRLVSIFVDPLLTGHYLFLGFILAEIFIYRNKRIIKCILLLCCLLTLSKGILMSFCFYWGFIVLKRFSYKDLKKILIVCLGGITVAYITIYNSTMNYMPTSSTAVHLRGFIKGLASAQVIGISLGKAGSITGVLTQTKMTTAESFIGTLAAQIGYLGLIIFTIYWSYVFISLLKIGKTENNTLSYNSAILLISVLAESMFSESSITIVGSGLYFVFAGICMSRKSRVFSKTPETDGKLNTE